MNRICGTETTDTEGIIIYHDDDHKGVLHIQNRNNTIDFSIQSDKNETIITSSDLVLSTPCIRVSGWKHNMLYQDIIIDPEGRLVPRPSRDWLYLMVGVIMFTITYWK
jgi:hypothetical protein